MDITINFDDFRNSGFFSREASDALGAVSHKADNVPSVVDMALAYIDERIDYLSTQIGKEDLFGEIQTSDEVSVKQNLLFSAAGEIRAFSRMIGHPVYDDNSQQ